MVSSLVSVRISVRRASPYSSLMARSSSLMIPMSLTSDARMLLSSSISLRTSSCSSTIFCRSSAARRRSCMSRIALAWISLRSNRRISVSRASRDDFAPEADERLQRCFEVHDLRPAIDEREHDDAERRLHLRVLVELVEDDLRDFPSRQLEHDADALAVGLVADLRDALDLLFLHQLGDLLDEARLV